MKKILVTTDFSTHSKAGMRFAIQLAGRMKAELVFFHCFQALIPTTIHRDRIENSMQEQAEKHLKKLEKFVAGLYRSMKMTPSRYRCVVKEELSPESAILEYAVREKFDFICISTRGAGGVQKIIGTNTSSIIHKSTIPVIAVPHAYRVREIKNLLYASDLENLEQEITEVTELTRSLGIRFDLAHFSFTEKLNLARTALDADTLGRKYPQLERVFLEPFDVKEKFAVQLDRLVKKINPSLVALFTHTNLTWFDKLFSISRSETFSFITKTPMLVYRKGGK
ncbi:MAG: universal stress protein [Thermoanaerobaculia bacterium]|nr:universal stress protein [Thermoanaerobaculia bacterium]